MDTKKIGTFTSMNRKKKGYTQGQLAEKLGVTIDPFLAEESGKQGNQSDTDEGHAATGHELLHRAASYPETLLMCDKEAIEVQKILPFLYDTWPLCRIGRAVIRASQSCRQSCNKSQCPACGCRSHHSCTHAPQFSRSFPAREWGSVLQRQGACGQCP